MPFSAPTLAQAQAALASRLNDPTLTHWTPAETAVYLREALRTWSAWTEQWRDQGTVILANPDVFYDLPSLVAGRTYNVTTWDLIADLQYALQEPAAPGGTWTGTDQFTLLQLTEAIQRRRDQFLRETGQVVTRQEIDYADGNRITFDESILIVRRALWTPEDTHLPAVLTRTDEWAADNFRPSWKASPAAPFAYSTTATPPLAMQIIPPTALGGTLDLISINKGAVIDPLVSAPLNIPDDWTWVIKWGALADLLQGDGLALDPQRAQYCESRWQQGIDLAKAQSVVLDAYFGTRAVQINAISDADSYAPTWMMVPGVPREILLTGGNLLASWPPPGMPGSFELTLDLIINVPVPLIGGDILQISSDVYDALLDYAQHLALFKEGAGQLQMAMALLERSSRAAGVTINLQQASQPSRVALLSQQLQEENANSREEPGLSVGG